MNQRIRRTRLKRKLNTPTRYLCTGGFYTPYACPNCHIRYRYKMAYNTSQCESNKKLLWWDVFQPKQEENNEGR